MPVRLSRTLARALVLTSLALTEQHATASVLFENSVLFDFQTSGPIGLMVGQRAGVCATNVDESNVAILIGLLQADTGSLLAVKEATLEPGAGTCLTFQATGQTPSRNVVGIVVPNAHVTGQGALVQDRPGGGCIAASVQIQVPTVNNAAAQTFLYAPMQEHHEKKGQKKSE